MQCFLSFQTAHKHASCHCSVPTTPLPSVCSHTLPSAISLKPVFLQGSRKFLHQAFFADHPGLCWLSIIYSIGIFFCLFFVFLLWCSTDNCIVFILVAIPPDHCDDVFPAFRTSGLWWDRTSWPSSGWMGPCHGCNPGSYTRCLLLPRSRHVRSSSGPTRAVFSLPWWSVTIEGLSISLGSWVRRWGAGSPASLQWTRSTSGK